MSSFSTRSALSELKVVQGQQETEFYLHTVLTDEGESGIKLCLTDTEDVWEGELSEDDLDLLRARLKMDMTSYVQQTVAALTRDKLRDVSFEYQLKALPSNRMQLVWKKCVSADQIKIQLGSVSLEKSGHPNDHIRAIFSQCISSTSQLKNRIQELESTCERLAQERQNAVKRLDKCVSAKEELEHDLYSKFMAVLNSKKERIRLLEESGLENVSAGVNGGSPEEIPMTSGESIRKRGRSDFTKDTDTEEILPIKQTANTTRNRLEDSSLNLDDEGDEQAKCERPPAARRPRRQGPVRKQTPSKPVLPRASSGKGSAESSRQASSSRRSSMRKSASNSSSLGSMDPNDLLGEM